MAANQLNIQKQWAVAGVDGAYVGMYDSDGLFAGGYGTLPKGAQSWQRRWQAVKTLATEVPDRARVTITGDDRPQTFFIFDRTDSPTAAIQVSNKDQDLDNQMLGLNDYARDQYRVLLMDPSLELSSTQQLNLVVHSQAKATEYGQSPLQAGWQNMDLWKGEITPGSPTGVEEQTGHAFDHTFTMERQSAYPDNTALSTANEGTTQASGNQWADKYRFIRGAFYGDGTLTQINLPQTPAATHTNTDVNAVAITKRTAAGVVSQLVMGTDFTINSSPSYVTLTAPAEDDARYVIGLKY
jgi:hypothetical protein